MSAIRLAVRRATRRRYIHDFDTAAGKAAGYQELYDAMVARYPDRLNRGVLWNSAKSVMA